MMMKRRLLAMIGALLPAAALAHAAAAADAPVVAAARQAGIDDGFLRVREQPGERLELQVAARRYVHAASAEEGAARPALPSVTLVAVAHIGEVELYQQLQTMLDAHDLVLYESVKPPGATTPGGATDQERIESTRSAIGFVARMLESHQRDRGGYPATLDELQGYAADLDARLGRFVADARVDAWQRPLQYSADDGSYSLVSLGSDGQPGGDGASADLSASDLGPFEPFTPLGDDGIQAELARTLGLKFQLDAIDYDRPNWRCSDMTADQLERALKARGVDFAPIQGALAGSSFPARVVRLLLGLVRLADRFSGGAAVDMIKVVLIEMLGDSSVIDQAMTQLGPGMSEVLIEQRDQVVIDDLKAVMDHEPAIRSIAVLYGGGHMTDLARRLSELGYAPDGEATWTTAISVDLRRTNLDPAQLRQIRFMLRSSIRQQLQRRPVRENADRAPNEASRQ